MDLAAGRGSGRILTGNIAGANDRIWHRARRFDGQAHKSRQIGSWTRPLGSRGPTAAMLVRATVVGSLKRGAGAFRPGRLRLCHRLM
ncbi:MAG: hypothetical protein WCF48_18985, partial [Terriglobales bacterium]